MTFEHSTPDVHATLFSGTTMDGDILELRHARAGDVVCPACLSALIGADDTDPQDLDESAREVDPEAFSAELGMPAELAAAISEALAGSATGVTGTLTGDGALAEMDPLEALYPSSGAAGHDCTDAFFAPLWIARTPGCTLDARDHLLLGGEPDCECGLLDLFDALDALPDELRQSAMDAHVAAMNELYDHLMIAELLADNGAGAGEYLGSACLACLSDPAFHAEELDGTLTRFGLEMVTAIRAFTSTVLLGKRRAAGPLAPAGL